MLDVMRRQLLYRAMRVRRVLGQHQGDLVLQAGEPVHRRQGAGIPHRVEVLPKLPAVSTVVLWYYVVKVKTQATGNL